MTKASASPDDALGTSCMQRQSHFGSLPLYAYHLSDRSNLEAISREGLFTAKQLIEAAGLPEEHRRSIAGYRSSHIRLPTGAVIRDQGPMPPVALQRCLDPGISPTQWYELVNSHVFFWLHANRLARHIGACAGRPQVVMKLHLHRLLEQYWRDAFVTPFNVGNARRRAAPRGLRSFVRLQEWLTSRWDSEARCGAVVRARSHPPAEIAIRTAIPTRWISFFRSTLRTQPRGCQFRGQPSMVGAPLAPERFLDLHPSNPAWGHDTLVDHDRIRLHFVRLGSGPAVLLLHGWPGFWYDWRRVIPALAGKGYEVLAPDFRGFGDSEKPNLPPKDAYTSEAQSASIQSFVERLNLKQMIVVGYDVGSRVAQTLARWVPQRIRGLVLCNPSYPGIGNRRLEYAAQSQFWYQHFHNTSVADAVIGHNRETVRTYLSHFYDHWLGRKSTLRTLEFEAIVDTYAREGAVRGSLNWVRSGAGTGLSPKLHERTTGPDTPEAVQVQHATRILWGELDPIFPPSWADNLPAYFPNMKLKMLPGVGHFVPFEAPEEIVSAVEALSAT